MGAHKREEAQRPQCAKVKGPECPGVAAPFYLALVVAGCRGNCWYFTGVWVVMYEFDIFVLSPNGGITRATDTRFVGRHADTAKIALPLSMVVVVVWPLPRPAGVL